MFTSSSLQKKQEAENAFASISNKPSLVRMAQKELIEQVKLFLRLKKDKKVQSETRFGAWFVLKWGRNGYKNQSLSSASNEGALFILTRLMRGEG